MRCCETCSYFDMYEEGKLKLDNEDVGWGECSFFGQEFFHMGCCRNYQSRDFHYMMANLINANKMRIRKNKSQNKK